MPVRLCVRTALGIAATLAVWGCTSDYASSPTTTPPGAGKTVQALPSIAFSPNNLSATVGDTVMFAFGSVAHNVFFDTVSGAPADIPGTNTSTSVARVFTTAGQYVYNCHIHPGMKGMVTVTSTP